MEAYEKDKAYIEFHAIIVIANQPGDFSHGTNMSQSLEVTNRVN